MSNAKVNKYDVGDSPPDKSNAPPDMNSAPLGVNKAAPDVEIAPVAVGCDHAPTAMTLGAQHRPLARRDQRRRPAVRATIAGLRLRR